MNKTDTATDNEIVKTSDIEFLGEVGKLAVVEVGGTERSVDEGIRPRISEANFSIFVSFTKDCIFIKVMGSVGRRKLKLKHELLNKPSCRFKVLMLADVLSTTHGEVLSTTAPVTNTLSCKNSS